MPNCKSFVGIRFGVRRDWVRDQESGRLEMEYLHYDAKLCTGPSWVIVVVKWAMSGNLGTWVLAYV